jgi:hypothetical protein
LRRVIFVIRATIIWQSNLIRLGSPRRCVASISVLSDGFNQAMVYFLRFASDLDIAFLRSAACLSWPLQRPDKVSRFCLRSLCACFDLGSAYFNSIYFFAQVVWVFSQESRPFNLLDHSPGLMNLERVVYGSRQLLTDSRENLSRWVKGFGLTGILTAFWSNNLGSWCAFALPEALMLLKLIRLVCLLQSLDGCLKLSLEFIDGELSGGLRHQRVIHRRGIGGSDLKVHKRAPLTTSSGRICESFSCKNRGYLRV